MKTTYYLQTLKSKRQIISASFEAEATLNDTCEAPSWIDAKREFGFELSPEQIEILRRREEEKRRNARLAA